MRRVIATATEGLSEPAKAVFPKYESVQRQLNRDRKLIQAPYPVPRNLAEIDIPAPLRNTKTGEAFLLHDSGAQDPERFLIFSTPRNLATLEASQVLKYHYNIYSNIQILLGVVLSLFIN